MTCPQCGTENAADARLCRHCGATLPEGPQPVPLRLQHVAASRLCLLTATVSTAGLVLFLLLTLLFPAMQHGFHELAASVGVLLPKDGRLFGGAAFFFFLPSAALCAGLWLAWRAARKEEPVPLTAYRAFRAAAWMEFVLLTVLCLPLHLYLFPFHLPDFARSRVLSGYIRSAGHLGDQSGVFLREPPLSAGSRLAHPARKAGHGSVQRDARHQCTSCACHGARRILRPLFGEPVLQLFPAGLL